MQLTRFVPKADLVNRSVFFFFPHSSRTRHFYFCFPFTLPNSLHPGPKMQAALRLARQNGHHLCRARTLTTTASPSAHVVGSSTSPAAKPSMIPLSNVEAQWAKMTSEEKMTVHEQLEVLQQKDWKELSIDEKKAGALFYVSCFI
jgi:hypothetical protein